MANATFGVNILPKDNTVSIGNSNSPWTIVSPSLTGTPTAPTASSGTNSTQVATTEFVQSAFSSLGNAKLGQGIGVCSTAAATTAKEVSLSNYALTTGGVVSVRFTYAVPASATLNVNSKGANAIYYKGAAITAGVIDAGDLAVFMYDGTQYQLIAIEPEAITNNEIDALFT